MSTSRSAIRRARRVGGQPANLIMVDAAFNREDVPCESDEHVFRPEVYEAAAGDTWIEDECCTSCGWSWRAIADHDRGKRTNQDAYDEIQKIFASLPDEDARKVVLLALLTKRCRKCLAYDPNEQFWCCYNLRGG